MVTREAVERLASEMGIPMSMSKAYVTFTVDGTEYRMRGFRKAYQWLYDRRRRASK